MKLKPKISTQPPRTERVKLEGESVALLDQYARYYQHTYGDVIDASDLLAEIAVTFMKADRDFMKWRQAASVSVAS